MSIYSLEMWASDQKLLLADILERLQFRLQPSWILFQFSGVGDAPDGLEMSVFERKIKKIPSGYRFSPHDFHKFTNSLQDLSDLKLIGVLDDQRKIVEIHAVDSTYWYLWVDDDVVVFSP
jgi:hypothetical protein